MGKLYGQVEETFASDSGCICGQFGGRIRPRFGEKLCQDLMGKLYGQVEETFASIPAVFAADLAAEFGQDLGRNCVKT